MMNSMLSGRSPASRRDVLIGAGSAVALAACNQNALGRPLLAADAHPTDYPTVQAVIKMGDIF